MITKQELIDFETEIGDRFNNREIRAPIHLYHGNEDKIMRVFEKVNKENDWVCCTWRNHYQALLKGVPVDVLRERIMAGKSMVMNLPQYKFICSSIVGGIPSIAVGLALAAKLRGSDEHVWCWVGDMSAETGAFHEAYKYSLGHDLPITFVVENNSLSVLTPTDETWGRDRPYYLQPWHDLSWAETTKLIHYTYTNDRYPHAGAGVRVQF